MFQNSYQNSRRHRTKCRNQCIHLSMRHYSSYKTLSSHCYSSKNSFRRSAPPTEFSPRNNLARYALGHQSVHLPEQ